MPTIETNGGRTNYIQIQSETGGQCDHLVMVHGLGTSMSFWYLPHAVSFSKNYHVTLFDLRGHGRSSMPTSGYTPRALAGDLHALLDTLSIDRAHFVGHSFGGVVALEFACSDPGRVIDLAIADTQISTLRHLERKRQGELAEQLRPLLSRFRRFSSHPPIDMFWC